MRQEPYRKTMKTTNDVVDNRIPQRHDKNVAAGLRNPVKSGKRKEEKIKKGESRKEQKQGKVLRTDQKQ